MRRLRSDESGVVLLVTLMVLIALTVLGIATVFLTGLDNQISVGARAGDQALYVADAGINFGVDLATQNQGYISAGFCTTNYPGCPGIAANHGLTVQIDNAAGTGQAFQGVGSGGGSAPANFDIDIGPEQGASPLVCGANGASVNDGRFRFVIDSIGYGPGISQRKVEAHILTGVIPGICSGGPDVQGGYPNGG